MDESSNLYVNSRGILKSCDYHSTSPISSIKQVVNYPNIDILADIELPTIYVCGSALSHYIDTILPSITKPFVLVSGDCDETMPYDVLTVEQFDSFISHNLLVHWYCQNMVLKHDKITCIPIGLDYHTMSIPRPIRRYIRGFRGRSDRKPVSSSISTADQELSLVREKMNGLHFSNRIIKCYATFQFFMNTRYGNIDRRDAYDNINKDLVFYEAAKVARDISWNRQRDYAFVISPHGGGYDCHRTWEALILGCIPIVKTSAIDILYEDLPVLIVNDWKDITIELLQSTVDRYKSAGFNYDKLKLKYWMDKIKTSHNSV